MRNIETRQRSNAIEILKALFAEGEVMKKTLYRTAAILCAIITALSLIGCGGKENPRVHMQKGDEKLQVFDEIGGRAGEKINAFFVGIAREIESKKVPAADKVKKDTDEIIRLLNDGMASASAARKHYEEIIEQKNPGKYGDYAKLIVKYIDVSNSMITEVIKYFTNLQKDIASGKYDPENFKSDLQKFAANIQAKTNESNALRGKADELKSENSL